MTFTPKSVLSRSKRLAQQRSFALDQWQRRALVGMLFMILLTFMVSNVWALLWQTSDWLTATILPAVVIDLTNAERAASAMPALARSELLDEAARRKAEHMATKGYFAHYSPAGVSPWHWFREVEYHFAHAGENLAVHFTDSQAMVQAWMDSPSHRENIENQQFTEIGVGTARGRYNGHDTIFVVQMFGTPAQPTAVVAVSSEPADLVGQMPDEASVATVTSTDELAPEAPEAEGESPTAPILPAGETIGGTGADPVEVVEESRTQPFRAEVAQRERIAQAEDDVQDDLSTATIEEPYTSTTSQLYLVQDDVATQVTEVEQWVSTTYTVSTGLPAATSTAGTTSGTHAGPFMTLSTQPNSLLQFVYTILSVVTVGMVIWALQLELRRRRFVQVAYSLALLGLMGGLWYVHITVSGGGLVS